MKELRFDAVVIGAGAAGMAASLSVSKRGFSCALVDREDYMGGILLQCIHNGFGLQHFGEELTGPEFALRLEKDVRAAEIPFFSGTTVLSIDSEESGFSLILSSAANGVFRASCASVILAMGSRERNRGNIRIAGDRPAGVFTAGLSQRLINIDGYLPGKRAVIIGSGDIGLIMARRLTLSGAKVEAVVEIQPFPSGLTRNIVQCLNDYSIPLYLSHSTLRIIGRDRVEGVEIAPLENGAPRLEKAFTIDCDTVLLSVGLVPENELSAHAGISLNPVTNGAFVDSTLMTSVPGVFACGNVLHIHDLVDRVAGEASRAGDSCADWLEGARSGKKRAEVPLRAGANIRYTVPSTIDPESKTTVCLRSMVMLDRGILKIMRGGAEIYKKSLNWVRPGEMISVEIPAGTLGVASTAGEPFEISLNAAGEGVK
ncbi:MAG TPA: FAD-dependent oxidoreductase [Treponemataceae bacterium]|nr:FAD-dependent oxidoreductase [Treponemataceae bacterium]